MTRHALAPVAAILAFASVLAATSTPPASHTAAGNGRKQAVATGAGPSAAAPPPFRHFRVTVYIPVNIVQRMAADPAWMRSSWRTIRERLPVNEVFIESFRGGNQATGAQLDAVQRFFQSQGVQTAGGIAWAGRGGHGQFRSLCYTDPATRALVRRVSALTARHFQQIILDDFFFNNTKTASDIAAKGRQTWKQFRLRLMDQVARDLVLAPARAANPRVRIIIKFPNWYPSFPGLGYDLAQEPGIFGEIWTGDETRDPEITDQQLQPYESYEIFRYLENVAPGHNGGGWVDPYGIRFVDRYAGQLWDTMLAKAPAINLFEYTNLLQPAQPGQRPWASQNTSLDFAALTRRCQAQFGQPPLIADVADAALDQMDQIVGHLGRPIGLASYRPYQSSGEDFLRDIIGMIGVPVEMTPRWPAQARTVLLTATAKNVPGIVDRIAQALQRGQNIIITSGLLRALQDRGFDRITDMRVTPSILAPTTYFAGFGAGVGRELPAQAEPMLFPAIRFDTNEDWAVVRGLANGRSAPLLLMDRYGRGELYVWTMPENLNDLYRLPSSVLDALRRYLDAGLPVRMNAPARVSLFAYRNGAFVVHSYRGQPATVIIRGAFAQLRPLPGGPPITGTPARGGGYRFTLTIPPHSFAAFATR
ncbi:MAG: hypothetical protein ACRD17_02120 [Terriglobales bacterium]